MSKPWNKLHEALAYDGRFIKVLSKEYGLPDGQSRTYEIKEEGHVACVLALTKEQKVLIAKQFRPGPAKFLFELPAGFIDADETPEQTAKRELLEETGYTGEFTYLGSHVDSAYSTKIRHNFVATNCERVQAQQLDEGEYIEVLEVSVVEFKEILKQGDMSDIGTGYRALEELGLL